jgi:hypothetical protein
MIAVVRTSASEIVRILDDAAEQFEFPMLDNGYIYPLDVRLSAYCDSNRWAIVIEQIGVSNRDPSVMNNIYAYGNCLAPVHGESDFVSAEAYRIWKQRHKFMQTTQFYPVDDGPSAPLLNDDMELNPDARDFVARDKLFKIVREQEAYQKRGLELSQPERIELFEVIRYWLPEIRQYLVATEEELHKVVPNDLPLILRLDEWLHPDLANGDKPSACSTFLMIADVIENANAATYTPDLNPNTHWSNWPDGGIL